MSREKGFQGYRRIPNTITGCVRFVFMCLIRADMTNTPLRLCTQQLSYPPYHSYYQPEVCLPPQWRSGRFLAAIVLRC
jgi:hypothetical protein